MIGPSGPYTVLFNREVSENEIVKARHDAVKSNNLINAARYLANSAREHVSWYFSLIRSGMRPWIVTNLWVLFYSGRWLARHVHVVVGRVIPSGWIAARICCSWLQSANTLCQWLSQRNSYLLLIGFPLRNVVGIFRLANFTCAGNGLDCLMEQGISK